MAFVSLVNNGIMGWILINQNLWLYFINAAKEDFCMQIAHIANDDVIDHIYYI